MADRNTSPHVLVAVTAHGYGHAAQTAPVIDRLRQLHPTLRLTIATDIAPAVLDGMFHRPWSSLSIPGDVGMHMTSAFDVQRDASAQAYLEFHRNWATHVARAARTLHALAPDLVLANVAYLPLAAAAHAGIPAIAMSSLNWADIYQHFCRDRPEAAQIHGQMLDAYNSAARFLCLDPGMPMNALARRTVIGPVARLGRDRRPDINGKLRSAGREKLVLVNLGGIATDVDLAHWPHLAGVRWIVPAAWRTSRADCSTAESLGLPFPDLLRSCDALVGKPGYGTFTEAACNGTPMLYVRRGDWPEEPYLVHWLEHHARCLEIDRKDFLRGALATSLERLWAQAPRPPVIPTGIGQAAACLAEWL